MLYVNWWNMFFWEECLPELMKKLAKVKYNILDFDEVSSTFEGVLIGF